MTRVWCTGDKKMLNRTTDSSLPYTTTLRAPSAANIRTAGGALRVLTPTTAGIKLCVLLPTLFSNSIKAKAQGTCSWQGAPPFFRHPPSAVCAKYRNAEAFRYQGERSVCSPPSNRPDKRPMRRIPARLNTFSPAITSGLHQSRRRHDPFLTIGVSCDMRRGRPETRFVGLERQKRAAL